MRTTSKTANAIRITPLDTVDLTIFNQAEIARQMGVTRQAVRFWFNNKIPETRLDEFCDITRIPPEELRPDLY